jgi:transcriptional regulator with XRE-family HTH domain
MPLYHALGRYDGYNLKTILLQKGITPADLGKRAGGRISMSTVKNMVHRRRPSVREGTVRALARALAVPEEALRGEQEE